MSIESDLQSFMSIDEVCRKHKLTFKELIQYTKKAKTTSHTGELYIYQYNKKYRVYRKFSKNGKIKHRFVAHYPSLEEAIRARDYLEEYGWTSENIQQVRP